MKIYKYKCFATDDGEMNIRVEPIEVEEKSKTYVYSSNHARRIPKDYINKINPETCDLYLLEANIKLAAEKFIKHKQDHIDCYNRTIKGIEYDIKNLKNKYLGENK